MLDPAERMERWPSTKLVRGPAIATRSSTPGVPGSRAIWATPPKTNSVMPRMGIPFRRATHEWPSSWTRMETKKISAVVAPTAQ